MPSVSALALSDTYFRGIYERLSRRSGKCSKRCRSIRVTPRLNQVEERQPGVSLRNNMRRPYRDRLQAAILDWAGTTVDHGSLAPIRVFQKIFADRGIEVTDEEVRRDMGILKKDHIRSLLQVPRIAGSWERRYQKVPGE